MTGRIASRDVLHSRITTIVKLQNPIRPYAWGSHHAIAELQGRPAPTAEPEAELWIGDHPTAPSSALVGDCPVKLPDWISADPDAVLGPQVRRRYGDSLPFLVKLLAAARPLSIQVHPNAEQAREGYAREQRQGVPLESPRRSYCDPNGKQEILIALTRFSALCGFRGDAEVEQLVALHAGPQAAKLLTEPHRVPRAAALLYHLLELDPGAKLALCGELQQRADHPGRGDELARWVSRLCRRYPLDPTAIAPLLLNLVTLEPGQALVARPGTVHSYLEGFGVEVMTPSDNVVRGGLTPKHVDLPALRGLASPRPAPAEVLGPTLLSPTRTSYRAGVPEFEVTAEELTGASQVVHRIDPGPGILLCLAGRCKIESRDSPTSLELAPGEAALLPARVREYRLQGPARLFSVTTDATEPGAG
jgi:mannose-6-phosphate isomerase